MYQRRALPLLWAVVLLTAAAGARAEPPATADSVASTDTARLPWRIGDEAPAVAGIRLGDDRERVEQLLGKAAETNKSGNALALLYPERGLAIVLDQDREAAVLLLKTRAAGDIGGVRIGDARDAVLQRWGEPQAVQGAEALYIVGNWAVTIELGPDQCVAALSLGRVFGNTELQ